jgi:hypothetical protein
MTAFPFLVPPRTRSKRVDAVAEIGADAREAY